MSAWPVRADQQTALQLQSGQHACSAAALTLPSLQPCCSMPAQPLLL